MIEMLGAETVLLPAFNITSLWIFSSAAFGFGDHSFLLGGPPPEIEH